MVCGLWFVVCGLWFVVCGLWFGAELLTAIPLGSSARIAPLLRLWPQAAADAGGCAREWHDGAGADAAQLAAAAHHSVRRVVFGNCSLSSQVVWDANVTSSVSHVTRYTLHVTRHTSHVTRHTLHVTRYTSHVTRYTSHVTLHKSQVTRYTLHVTRHTLHVTRYTSHVTRHTLHITHHTSPAE